jgi:hypothetical protein
MQLQFQVLEEYQSVMKNQITAIGQVKTINKSIRRSPLVNQVSIVVFLSLINLEFSMDKGMKKKAMKMMH